MESAQVVNSIDDILIQILVRLPIKSLMLFKFVSKHWKSLITSPHFRRLRNPDPNPARGLFFTLPVPRMSEFDYIHLNAQDPINPPFRKLGFPEDPDRFWIHQSCNGLLVCCSSKDSDRRFRIETCYIYNPTTTQYLKLPRPGIVNGVPRIIHCVNLAFDHAKSSGYRAVCVRESEVSHELFQIEIYSADSRTWRVSGEPFSAKVNFDYGVYWNGSIHWMYLTGQRLYGSIHWMYLTGELLYFDVDQERLGGVPMPAMPYGKWVRKLDYFGESCDHLHLIESYDAETEFYVYEMKRDHSEWFVKYKVDLTIVANAFPAVAAMYASIDRMSHLFWIFSLIRGEKKDDSFLVFLISSKVMLFNLEHQTFEEIYNFTASVSSSLGFQGPRAFEYIESLACV